METIAVIQKDLEQHWAAIRPFLSIQREQDYEAAVGLLNELIDQVGDNEDHPLYTLLDTLGTVLSSYEEDQYPVPEASSTDILRYLMEEHGLNQSELPEIGSQGVVSEILRGKRSLNVRQIQALSKRFQVSPAVFIPQA